MTAIGVKYFNGCVFAHYIVFETVDKALEFARCVNDNSPNHAWVGDIEAPNQYVHNFAEVIPEKVKCPDCQDEVRASHTILKEKGAC